jgi:hypothetical protein
MTGKDYDEEFGKEFARKAAERRLAIACATLLSNPTELVVRLLASMISSNEHNPPPPDCGQGALVRR